MICVYKAELGKETERKKDRESVYVCEDSGTNKEKWGDMKRKRGGERDRERWRQRETRGYRKRGRES